MKTPSTKTAVTVMAAGALILGGCQNKSTTSSPIMVIPSTSAVAAKPAAAADNGVAKLSATEILKRSEKALKEAKSFHVTGSGVDQGQKTALDLEIDGKDAFGTLTTGKEKIVLLAVGGSHYIKPNTAFWASTAGAKAKTVEAVIGDRWVKVDGSKDTASIFSVTNVADMMKPDGKITKGATKQVDGVRVIALKDSSDGTDLYVATTGKPVPVAVDGADQKVNITEFGEKFSDIKNPSASQIIDFGSLGG
jgi:uncharacterized lipoprotein NlpE involved in copper resistance